MKYETKNFTAQLDNIYDLVVSNKVSKITKEEFKQNINSIIENLDKNSRSISDYWLENFSKYIYENSKKTNYENFSSQVTNKVNKEMYDMFYSLHRHSQALNLVDKKQLFQLLEALEALNSFKFKIIDLKKWSNWLLTVFDHEILAQYSKYIDEPIIYFLVIISDTLKPLKDFSSKEKNSFYKELKINQEFFQNNLVKDEKKYNEKLKAIQEYDEMDIEKVKLDENNHDLEGTLNFAKKYNISILRLFQFLSFPFFIEELDNIPQDILLKNRDNIIVYSEKYFWGFELNASEYFYRQVLKYNRIMPYVYLFLNVENKKMNSEYNQFESLVDFFIISENLNDQSLFEIINANLKIKTKESDLVLSNFKFKKNEEIFELIEANFKGNDLEIN